MMRASRRSLTHIATTLAAAFAFFIPCYAETPTPTVTSLTLSSTSVTTGTTVTLTAHVTASGVAVHPGTVTFCNASAPHCEDAAILGTAQLTTNGTAKLYLRLPPGTHSIKAIFSATPNRAIPRDSSTSTAVSITVKGIANSLTAQPTALKTGNFYRLSTIVNAFGPVPLTGMVSFHDTVNGGTPLLLGSAPVSPALTQPTYTLPSPVPSPVPTDTVVIGDFNNDGIPDLAGINGVEFVGTPTLVILLGKGDGTFTTTSMVLPNADFPAIGTAGDFNGDGNLDLAITGDYGAILLGHGDGTFSDPIFTGIFGPFPIIATDMNGDGILDLVGLYDNYVSSSNNFIALGNGDGTFTSSPFSGTLGNLNVVGDFNNDGISDIVTIPDYSSNDAQTFLLNADGTFTTKDAFPLLPSPQNIQYMATGDFNDDGIPDIVASRFDNSVVILLGKGDGTFTPSAPINFPTPRQNLSVADFNSDGKLDVAFLSNTSSPTLTILPGNGDGTFGAPYNLTPVKPIGYPFVVADFNSDGINDIFYETPQQNPNWLYLLQGERAWPASIANIALQTDLVHNITASYQGSAAYTASQSSASIVPTFPNITAKLHFVSTGFIYSRITNTFNCTLTVTNTSGSSIAGPIQIGFKNLPPNISLANPTSPQVPGFIAIPGGLVAGQSTSLSIRFNNPLSGPIALIPVAYTGAF
jgi:Bacterial Ig-like domain (group 3)/FG-GAP-like repeat